MKISFDVGGVLSKYPEIFRPMIKALQSSDEIEVFIITDMIKHEQAVDYVNGNEFDIPKERIICADFDTHGEYCKAEVIKELGIDIHIDDFMSYGFHTECLTLLTMPNPYKPYYHETWETGGDETSFGRKYKRILNA